MPGKLSRQKRKQSSLQGSGVRRWMLSKGMTYCLAGAATAFSGCAYTGGVKDYIHNGFKVGPNYAKPAAPVASNWIDDYDDRIKDELPNYGDCCLLYTSPSPRDRG